MKSLILPLVFCASVFAAPELSNKGIDETAEVGSEFAQIGDMKTQLEIALNTLPPQIQRVALYRVRMDRKEFSSGMNRYIQSQIEEAFFNQRREVVGAPELKTLRISATDTSFQLSNAVSDAEELWKLGRKHRIDAFMDGSVTRSKDGDLVLTLKLIRQETADVIWNKTLIIGPNQGKNTPAEFEFIVNGGWGYWNVKEFQYKDIHRYDGLKYYKYFTEFGLQQNITDNRTWFIALQGGFGYLVPIETVATDTSFDDASVIPYGSGGFTITHVLKNKIDPTKGYYLGAYGGIRAMIPNSMILGEFGLSTRPASHFGLSLGVSTSPLNNTLKSGLFGKNQDISTMETLSYDARIQFYLF